MPKTAILHIRLDAKLKEAAESAAGDDQRTLTSYIEKLLTDALRKSGHLKQGRKK